MAMQVQNDSVTANGTSAGGNDHQPIVSLAAAKPISALAQATIWADQEEKALLLQLKMGEQTRDQLMAWAVKSQDFNHDRATYTALSQRLIRHLGNLVAKESAVKINGNVPRWKAARSLLLSALVSFNQQSSVLLPSGKACPKSGRGGLRVASASKDSELKLLLEEIVQAGQAGIDTRILKAKPGREPQLLIQNLQYLRTKGLIRNIGGITKAGAIWQATPEGQKRSQSDAPVGSAMPESVSENTIPSITEPGSNGVSDKASEKVPFKIKARKKPPRRPREVKEKEVLFEPLRRKNPLPSEPPAQTKSPDIMSVPEIDELVLKFLEDYDWQQTPKDLAGALKTEGRFYGLDVSLWGKDMVENKIVVPAIQRLAGSKRLRIAIDKNHCQPIDRDVEILPRVPLVAKKPPSVKSEWVTISDKEAADNRRVPVDPEEWCLVALELLSAAPSQGFSVTKVAEIFKHQGSTSYRPDPKRNFEKILGNLAVAFRSLKECNQIMIINPDQDPWHYQLY
ncbi:MAG: hypothetical protein WC508_01815 [Patescibacteria group bacterium]